MWSSNIVFLLSSRHLLKFLSEVDFKLYSPIKKWRGHLFESVGVRSTEYADTTGVLQGVSRYSVAVRQESPPSWIAELQGSHHRSQRRSVRLRSNADHGQLRRQRSSTLFQTRRSGSVDEPNFAVTTAATEKEKNYLYPSICIARFRETLTPVMRSCL